MSENSKATVGEALHRAQLVTRLSRAASVLPRWSEETAAILEAIEVIRAIPYGPVINEALYPKLRWSREAAT